MNSIKITKSKSEKEKLPSRFFEIEIILNSEMLSGYEITAINEINNIPNESTVGTLYYIELSTLRSQKSHFNDTMFYDYELHLWEMKNKVYTLGKNNWKLKFTRMPTGLGAGTLALDITDDQQNKISFNMWADSRDAMQLCKNIVAEVHRFHKMADGLNLRSYFDFGR